MKKPIPVPISNVHPVPERVDPVCKAVSLDFDKACGVKKYKRVPARMPAVCKHLQSVIQMVQIRKSQRPESPFLVRGFEVCRGGPCPVRQPRNDPVLLTNEVGDEFKCIENRKYIRLTKCCQCVCDFLNTSYRILEEIEDFGFPVVGDTVAEQEIRRMVSAQVPENTVLDPNILKVIRVTMSAKK